MCIIIMNTCFLSMLYIVTIFRGNADPEIFQGGGVEEESFERKMFLATRTNACTIMPLFLSSSFSRGLSSIFSRGLSSIFSRGLSSIFYGFFFTLFYFEI